MSKSRPRPKWEKVLKWTGGILLATLIILWLVFRFALGDFGAVDEEAFNAHFDKMPMKPLSQTYEMGPHTMHYMQVGKPGLPMVLFIHGSPGSWDAYASYLQDSLLLDRVQMISVDRMGYGKSAPGVPESSLKEQADSIWPVIEGVPDSVPLIVVGHSYGGPVATRLAMDHPDRVDGLMILAGLADPAHEKRLSIQSYLRSPYLRWLLPPALDISNREIVPLKEELTEIMPLWPRIRANTVIMQGTEDVLVAYPHATFAADKLKHVAPLLVSMESENHFFIWTRFSMVRDYLLEMVDCVRTSS